MLATAWSWSGSQDSLISIIRSMSSRVRPDFARPSSTAGQQLVVVELLALPGGADEPVTGPAGIPGDERAAGGDVDGDRAAPGCRRPWRPGSGSSRPRRSTRSSVHSLRISVTASRSRANRSLNSGHSLASPCAPTDPTTTSLSASPVPMPSIDAAGVERRRACRTPAPRPPGCSGTSASSPRCRAGPARSARRRPPARPARTARARRGGATAGSGRRSSPSRARPARPSTDVVEQLARSELLRGGLVADLQRHTASVCPGLRTCSWGPRALAIASGPWDRCGTRSRTWPSSSGTVSWSSTAVRGPTSGTPTGTATSTRRPACGSPTSATAGRSWPTRPRRRCGRWPPTARSATTSRRRRSSWPSGWPGSHRYPAARCSSPPADPTRSTPPPSWPAATGSRPGIPRRRVIIGRQKAYHGMHYAGTALGGIPGNRRGVRRAGARHRHRRVGLRRRPARDHRAGRSRAGGGVLLRAGGRRRRRVPAAPGLPRGGAQALHRARRAVRGRRGDHRVRADRRGVVRVVQVRARAGPRHLREGADVGVCADGRRPRRAAGVGAVLRAGAGGVAGGTGTPTRGTRRPRPSRWPTSTSSSGRACSTRRPGWRRRSPTRLGPLADLEGVVEVRCGTGALAAVQLADPPTAMALAKRLRSFGVATRAVGAGGIQVSPPFVMTDDQVGDLADAITAALAA